MAAIKFAANGIPLVKPKQGPVLCRVCSMPQAIHWSPCGLDGTPPKLMIDDSDAETKRKKGPKVAAN